MYGFPPFKSIEKEINLSVTKQKSFIDKSKSFINVRQILSKKKKTIEALKIPKDNDDINIVTDL